MKFEMRSAPHPDVTYWRCPEGDAKILIAGHVFSPMDCFAALGMTVEPSDLDSVLPLGVLADAEAAVERHEVRHGITRATEAVA